MGIFLSEHTAEFYLVPHAVRVFERFATAAMPIYFWATREGNHLGRSSVACERVRVLSIFARRPKVHGIQVDTIAVKLIRQLFAYAEEARELQIPTLAGIPLVASLEQLRFDCRCVWFRLLSDCVNDIEIPLTLQGEPLEAPSPTCIDGPKQLECLAEKAVSAAVALNWTDAILKLRYLRNVSRQYFYYARYSPIHVLLIE